MKMETRMKVLLLAAVSIITTISLGTVAYAQEQGVSTNTQCGSMMGSGGMGGMNNMGMMGQSECTRNNCTTTMVQNEMSKCQDMRH